MSDVCPLETPELVEKILTFCESFGNLPLYSYQKQFGRRLIESLLLNDGDVITALWARQCGKTTTIGEIVAGLMVVLPVLARAFPRDVRLNAFSRGFWCAIFAPIKFQSDLAYAKIREIFHSETANEIMADEEIDVTIVASRADSVVLSTGSFVRAVSASPEAQIEGQTLHLAVCEESQKLSRQKVEKEITPMLASTNGSMVKIGTAWESRGGFHNSIQHNQAVQERTGKRNHFQFDYEVVIREKDAAYRRDNNSFHLQYAKFVQKEIARLGGIDSLEFKMNFRCLWNESRSVAVDLVTLQRAWDPYREAAPRKFGVQVAGLDLGKKNDRTVLTLMGVDMEHPIYNRYTGPEAEEERQIYYPKAVEDWLELEGAFEGASGQYEMIVHYLTSMTAVRVLVVDTTGMGDPIAERLSLMLGESIVLVPFVFSVTQKGHGFKYYLQELKSGRVSIPAGPMTQAGLSFQRFMHEHEQLERYLVGNHVLVSAPDGPEEHDDYPCSAMLACWGEKNLDSVLMPEIQVSATKSGSNSGDELEARHARGRWGRRSYGR